MNVSQIIDYKDWKRHDLKLYLRYAGVQLRLCIDHVSSVE